MLVPMITTNVPGSVTVAAGTETCASTFATATASRRGGPSSRRLVSERPPARPPSGDDLPRHLLVDRRARTAGRARRSTRRSGSRRASTTSPCSPRCSCCASRRRLAARRPSRQLRSGVRRGRRPRAPRRGSAAPWRRTTRTRSCRRSVAATARPRSRRDGVDPIRLRLRRVVLPELHPRVRLDAEDRRARRAASRLRSSGSIVHEVKSMPMPTTSAGSTPVSARSCGTVS